MKKILLLTLLSLAVLSAKAQEYFTKFRLSGFDITITLGSNFAYQYDVLKNPVSEEKVGGVLVLTVKMEGYGNDTKNPLRITAKQIDELDLHNCNLTYDNAATMNALKLDLKQHSNIKLFNINANSIHAIVNTGAILTIGGNVNKMYADIKAASTMNTLRLTIEEMKIDIVSASKADLDVIANTLEINAKLASNIKLRGTANKLITNTDMAVVLDGSGLIAEKGAVNTSRGCMVTVNVKDLPVNPEIDNVYGQEKGEKRKKRDIKDFEKMFNKK